MHASSAHDANCPPAKPDKQRALGDTLQMLALTQPDKLALVELFVQYLLNEDSFA